MSDSDYEYLGNFAACEPWAAQGMSCDDCKVSWTGCWDNFQCPKCGNGELPSVGDDVRMFVCGNCGGTGWVEGEPHSYNPRNGEPICQQYRCTCENGLVPVEHVLIDEDDFDDCFGL